jgi:hypothetical protein
VGEWTNCWGWRCIVELQNELDLDFKNIYHWTSCPVAAFIGSDNLLSPKEAVQIEIGLGELRGTTEHRYYQARIILINSCFIRVSSDFQHI